MENNTSSKVLVIPFIHNDKPLTLRETIKLIYMKTLLRILKEYGKKLSELQREKENIEDKIDHVGSVITEKYKQFFPELVDQLLKEKKDLTSKIDSLIAKNKHESGRLKIRRDIFYAVMALSLLTALVNIGNTSVLFVFLMIAIMSLVLGKSMSGKSAKYRMLAEKLEELRKEYKKLIKLRVILNEYNEKIRTLKPRRIYGIGFIPLTLRIIPYNEKNLVIDTMGITEEFTISYPQIDIQRLNELYEELLEESKNIVELFKTYNYKLPYKVFTEDSSSISSLHHIPEIKVIDKLDEITSVVKSRRYLTKSYPIIPSSMPLAKDLIDKMRLAVDGFWRRDEINIPVVTISKYDEEQLSSIIIDFKVMVETILSATTYNKVKSIYDGLMYGSTAFGELLSLIREAKDQIQRYSDYHLPALMLSRTYMIYSSKELRRFLDDERDKYKLAHLLKTYFKEAYAGFGLLGDIEGLKKFDERLKNLVKRVKFDLPDKVIVGLTETRNRLLFDIDSRTWYLAGRKERRLEFTPITDDKPTYIIPALKTISHTLASIYQILRRSAESQLSTVRNEMIQHFSILKRDLFDLEKIYATYEYIDTRLIELKELRDKLNELLNEVEESFSELLS